MVSQGYKRLINFVEKTKIPHNAIMVSLDVTSLYTNIPQDEGIETIYKAYETFYQSEAPIPTNEDQCTQENA